MKLSEVLKNIKPLRTAGDMGVEINGVNIDSRRVGKGHLFIAMKGTVVDGHQFIAKAIELGARAILCEDMPEEQVEGVTYVHRRRRGQGSYLLLWQSFDQADPGGRHRNERKDHRCHLII